MALIAIFIAGLAILIGGYIANYPLAQVVGGAILGAAFSTYFSKIAIERYIKESQSIIKKTLGSKFCGDETRAAKHRKKWHIYHKTELDGQLIWRHHVLDFTKKVSIGSLVALGPARGKNHEDHPYVFEGAFRDARLIITQKEPDSDEPYAVYVFPFMSEQYDTTNAGIVFVRTWDKSDGILPTLICLSPIDDITANGSIDDMNKSKKLSDTWKTIVRRENKFVLPDLVDR